MENTREMELQVRVENKELKSQKSSKDTTTTQLKLPTVKHYKWWFRVSLYILFLLTGQSAATLLGRLYYDKGGNSKWMATFVQSAGFPILIPILLYFLQSKKILSSNNDPRKRPTVSTLLLLFLFFGLFSAGVNLMYSYGLLYLPVSTYSLICATQLAFNAIFSFLLNSQKFTALIFNSLVLLTVSASLLAVQPGNSTKVSEGKYIIGFLCTVGASAAFSLMLSLSELTLKKVLKIQTFDAVLMMQIFPSFVATCACVVGLFASGEWKTLGSEFKTYQMGRVSYVMNLFWTAVSWQVSSVGMLGLIFEVSSLFANVISTVSLPAIPILAVIFFHDKMDGVKIIALILAIWGFLSYVYQHYLDDVKAKSSTSMPNEEDSDYDLDSSI
ncbi:hypothetical protein ACH5RR_038914 [Cinchona calisaya]|uniref:Probable purine permease n=1 Tax=Cinchona calisaya TaxID=153742 RepID=A0ABD2XWP2_9GENT